MSVLNTLQTLVAEAVESGLMKARRDPVDLAAVIDAAAARAGRIHPDLEIETSIAPDLPPALARLRRKLGSGDEADRRFVRVLAAVLTDGLDAVEAAIREALDAGAASDEVILNILARYREPATDRPLDVVVDLKLNHPPMADCARYDTVRGLDAAA